MPNIVATSILHHWFDITSTPFGETTRSVKLARLLGLEWVRFVCGIELGHSDLGFCKQSFLRVAMQVVGLEIALYNEVKNIIRTISYCDLVCNK